LPGDEWPEGEAIGVGARVHRGPSARCPWCAADLAVHHQVRPDGRGPAPGVIVLCAHCREYSAFTAALGLRPLSFLEELAVGLFVDGEAMRTVVAGVMSGRPPGRT
jgi:hypothetical protein